MPFPVRDYFPLKMLQSRWPLVVWEDITYVVENGLLRACVYLPMRWMEYGHRESGKFMVDNVTHCEGWVGIQAKDTRRIFSHGETTASTFESIRHDQHLLRMASEPSQKPLRFNLDEIVVMAKDCAAFEEMHQLEVRLHNGKVRFLRPTDNLPDMPADSIFSNNYQNIHVGNDHYQLGMIQAQVIRKLHEAMVAGDPWVHGKILLYVAGSTSTRLRDTFKEHPVWKALVESDRRGYYRLHLPNVTPKRQQRKDVAQEVY